MVTIFPADPFRLRHQVGFDRLGVLIRAGAAPGGALGLEIHPFLVGRRKGGFRRTPRVETDLVETIGLVNLEDPAPFPDVGARIAGPWEGGTIEIATHQRRNTIDQEGPPVGADLAKTKG